MKVFSWRALRNRQNTAMYMMCVCSCMHGSLSVSEGSRQQPQLSCHAISCVARLLEVAVAAAAVGAAVCHGILLLLLLLCGCFHCDEQLITQHSSWEAGKRRWRGRRGFFVFFLEEVVVWGGTGGGKEWLRIVALQKSRHKQLFNKHFFFCQICVHLYQGFISPHLIN